MKLDLKQKLELSKIGNKYIYEGVKNDLNISAFGITKIIKAYEKMKQEHQSKLSEPIAKWDEELKKEYERMDIKR